MNEYMKITKEMAENNQTQTTQIYQLKQAH